jgi:hypothetical protein
MLLVRKVVALGDLWPIVLDTQAIYMQRHLLLGSRWFDFVENWFFALISSLIVDQRIIDIPEYWRRD